jgi:DNA polymerase-3 subunit epsilon
MSIPSPDDLVIVDVETSGVNPFENEILAVGLVPLTRPGNSRVVYVDASDVVWGDFAKKNFTKFEHAWKSQAVAPQEACATISSFLRSASDGRVVTPIGHNIGFDTAFLRRLAFRAGKSEIAGLSHRAIDTHSLLYVLYMLNLVPASALSSDGALRFFGIDVPDDQRHTALGDAMATRVLVLRIFEEFEIRSGQTIFAQHKRAQHL